MMKKKRGKRRILATYDPGVNLGDNAYFGIFPDDFIVNYNLKSDIIARLVYKHLIAVGESKYFSHLVDGDRNVVEITSLKARSIAELMLKLDLHNLVWD